MENTGKIIAAAVGVIVAVGELLQVVLGDNKT